MERVEPLVLLLRILRVLLIFAALGLAAAPVLMLINLTGGGTGYGLCEQGWTSCDGSFSAGLVRMTALCAGLFLLAGGVRMLSSLIRRIERRRQFREYLAAQGAPPG